MEKEINIILPVMTLILGYLLSYWSSYKNRKQLKEQFELNISQQKQQFEKNIELQQGQFENNIKHKKEIDELERKDKMKMIAIEKRLEAHQLALRHWYYLRDIMGEENSEKRRNIVESAFEFWYSNCLYLEKQTRDKFYEAALIADRYPINLQLFRSAIDLEEKKTTNNLLKEHWDKFHELHPIIFSEVELEPINSPDKDKKAPGIE